MEPKSADGTPPERTPPKAPGRGLGRAKPVALTKARPAFRLPAAATIGLQLATTIEQWFQQGRERRLDNLGAHVERAIRINGRGELERVASTAVFTEWAEGVSRVDPEDRALADIWQAALLALRQGGARRMRLMTIAERVQVDEAADCLEFLSGTGRFTAVIQKPTALLP